MRNHKSFTTSIAFLQRRNNGYNSHGTLWNTYTPSKGTVALDFLRILLNGPRLKSRSTVSYINMV